MSGIQTLMNAEESLATEMQSAKTLEVVLNANARKATLEMVSNAKVCYSLKFLINSIKMHYQNFIRLIHLDSVRKDFRILFF